MRQFLMSTVLICAATLAQAQDEALIVGISDYANLPDVRNAADVQSAANALQTRGFRIFGPGSGSPSAAALEQAGNAFAAVSDDADRMIVVLSGQFVHDGARTWLLASDADQPQPFSVGRQSLSVDAALSVLGRAPGAAVLILAFDDTSDLRPGAGFRAGIGDLNIPSGVTVVRGRVDAARDLMRDIVASPGENLVGAVRRNRDLMVTGFAPDTLVLVPDGAPSAPTASGSASGSVDLQSFFETSAWDRARRTDTEASYAEYLDRYPQGANARQAVTRLQELRDPNRAVKAAEEALDLPLEARRAIQRDLQVLGYDTRGIDGIFGPGTRGAIKAWQSKNNVTPTGYLGAGQISLIDSQAADRSAALEAEALARREQERRNDRAYWTQTGQSGTAAGLRSYLERYPDGQYAAEAKAELDVIQRRNRQAAAEADRAAWDRAVQASTIASYQAYLADRPKGAFAEEAEARIAAARQAAAGQAANTAAAERERALALDPISLRLIEARLAQLGLEPGAVDGRIDTTTRQAIRRYQSDRQLTASGFLDQATVSRMLTDAFR